jgi:PKD repeat protein
MKRAIRQIFVLLTIISLCLPVVSATPALAQEANAEPVVVQTAVISEDYGYLNLSNRGGRPGGGGVDGDGPPPLQQASMTATFANFELNGIPFATWTTCRQTQTVDQCLATLGDTMREQHPGDIGGDTFTFDITITNTSPAGGPVLTTFAFQSKFSESPALGSRIGDKLFSAQRDTLTSNAANPLIGVKKNGTTNGLFGGKIKGICINSSDDYPSDLNLGVENETLECTGGRTFNRDTNWPVLQAADGGYIDSNNIKLPKGLLPGESMTMRLVLDAGTDDGALQRAYAASCDLLDPVERDLCKSAVGPLIGTLANVGEFRAPDKATECLELDIQPVDNVLDVVNFGDVKIIRDSDGKCAPSFDPFSKNQFLTIPRHNWGFTDILDTRDDYTPPDGLPDELPTVLTGDTGKFSFLDFGNLKAGEMNFFEILRGFGEFGATLDPSCKPGGSQEGKCGGEAYVPWAEFYAIANGKLVRQEVVGNYGQASYTGGPSITATIDTNGQTNCRGSRLPVKCKTTDPFEIPGQPNPGSRIGASAMATFSDVEVIADDKTTIANEGGQAGGNLVRFTVNITNTSPQGSNIYLTSFNFQTKQRGLTDINVLDGTTIQGRQDLRTGPVIEEIGFKECGVDPKEAACFDRNLSFTRDDGTYVDGIGRFPNVLGNSLLSSTFVVDPSVNGPIPGKLEAIKKNGTFQPLTKTDFGVANFICIKSGPPSDDQDADETCFGEPGMGLLPGESQSVRLQMDYGDFRGLILRVAPGTMVDYDPVLEAPFGLLQQGGDFDCGDQRRLPYCHPDLVGQRWFTRPDSLATVEFVTVHQPGDAASVMNFEQNFGVLLAMAGFVPTAEFYQGSTQMQVRGAYLNLPGPPIDFLNVAITNPAEGIQVKGTVEVTASAFSSQTISQVEFFVDGASIGKDTNGADGWSATWDTTLDDDGPYQLTATATAVGLAPVTSAVRNVTVANALTVQIVQPASNSALTGTITLVAQTAGLTPATGVSFSYSGSTTPIGAAAETSPGVWELTWDTSAIPAGDYDLTAIATNGTETATAAIKVEVVALKVTIVAPDSGAFLSGMVELQAEVISAVDVDSVEFFYDPDEWPDANIENPVPLGTATYYTDRGLWVLEWDTREHDDTPLTKPRTEDQLSVVVTANGATASDTADIRIGNMLTARIFLPDNQEDLRGYEDLEVFVSSQYDITSVRFDLYHIDDVDPNILIPFGQASPDGQRILDYKYGRPLGDPGYPTGSPIYFIGEAVSEGSSRYVIRDWDTKTIPDGTYGLVATAYDRGDPDNGVAPRKGTYMVETYIVNDLKVMISAPANGADVRGFVALEARTSGLFPATGVTFDVNGTEHEAEEVTPGRWRAVWDARSATPEGYTITATATNIAAETATDSVDVTLVATTGQAFFDFDWTNCTLLTCSFLDSSGADSWLWKFGDGNTSIEQNPTHTYGQPGVYTVSLTAGGSTYSRKIPVGTIEVVGFNTNPINDAGNEFITWTSALKDFAYEVGETIYVPAMWKATTGPTQFWSLPETVLFTPEEADGTDPVLVDVADDGILFTITFTEVQYRGDTGIFKGKVNLGIEVLADSGDGDPDLDWTARLGTNVDVTNTALVDEGDFLNVWVVHPKPGQQVSGTVEVRAAPETSVPVTKIEFFADGSKIGEDTNGAGGWTVDWDTTGLNGDYQLTAMASGGGIVGTSTAVTVKVVNDPLPNQPPTADFTYTTSDLTVYFTDQSTDPDGSVVAWEWDFGDGNYSTVQNPTHTYAVDGMYTVTLKVTDNESESDEKSADVVVSIAPPVNEEPIAAFTYTTSGLTVNFTDGSHDPDGNVETWAWEFGDGNASTDQNPMHTYASSGTYTVSLTVTDNDGATGTFETTVTVSVGPYFTGSSAPGARGTWNATISVTGAPANTTISGTWNIGGTPHSCTTNGSGACSFTRTGIRNNVSSVTWTYTATGQTVRITRP